MRPALLIYCIFLAIEAGLAWMVTGNWFLAAAAASGLLIYAGVWRVAGPWGELVRALFAGLVTVAGPLYYRSELVPTVMCFLALPHLLAATQCFWEMALQNDPAQQNARMRTVVFSFAFYAAMGLVFMLLRGVEPALSRWVTSPLAVVVLLMALPAWDIARIARLKPGHAMKLAETGGTVRRACIAAAAVIGMTVLFSGLLPPAAEKLCEVSPRWKSKEPAPAPPVPQPAQGMESSGGGKGGTGEANRPGVDSSDMAGQHQLPEKANIQSSGDVRLYIKCTNPKEAERLAAGPVYVRTHTFDSYRDGVWKSAVTGARWLEDAADGAEDGWTKWQEAPGRARAVEHTVYLNGADGFSLPALQGVFGYHLSRVYAVPGELYQTQLAGSVRYDAVSAPVIYDLLPGRGDLKSQDTGSDAHLQCTGGQTITQLVFGDKLLRPEGRSLAEKVDSLRQWFAANVKYSTRVAGRPPLQPLDNFLIGERRGYCDFFASAGCLMMREAGVPARVAYGYAGRSFDAVTGVFTFTDDTAHAWTEIHLRDFGWVVCDFTPQDHIGSLNNESASNQPKLDESAFDEAAKEKEKEEKSAEEPPPPPGFAAWWEETMQRIKAADTMSLLKRGLLLAAMLAAVFVLVRWLKKCRKQGSSEERFDADAHQPFYFAEFLRVFREAGWPRMAGATPREYVAALQREGAAGAEFAPMLSYHYAVRYTGGAEDCEKENEWLALVKEAERRFRQDQNKA